ncbi:MAG: transketolase family protein [Micromonosporaceae bacterium]
MRERFIEITEELLKNQPRTALVLADISSAQFAEAADRHPDRVVNVGIREQLMLGVAGGLALTGLRPIAHSYATFLVERTYEQAKLDIGHQGVGAILVSVGASYDWTQGGRTHQSPGDVALLDTLPGWTVHVPGHPDEVERALRDAVDTDDPVYIRLSTRSNTAAHPATHPAAQPAGLTVLRRGGGPLVVAVGPALDNVLAATEGLDATVAYTSTVRPFDTAGLRAVAPPNGDVVLVEPYLAGTSSYLVNEALADRPHRVLGLGVPRRELRRYGTPEQHDTAYGLDPAGLRRAITALL